MVGNYAWQKPQPDYDPSDDEYFAIEFLADEWDWGGLANESIPLDGRAAPSITPKEPIMSHRDALKHLADNAPNKHNSSPQFSDDDVTAHSVHSGRKGGNKIDQKQGAAIGAEMLAALAAGELQIVSVSPPEFADPAKLKAINDAVADGTSKLSKLVTSQIAEERQPRMKSAAFTFSGGPTPSLTVVYKTA